MKILLTGGGSGGHIMPILSVAEELKKQAKLKNIYLELLWIGEKNSQEEKVAKKYNLQFKGIFCGKIRRYFSFRNFFDVIIIPIGCFQARWILRKFKPDIIFSKGGYVSAPVIFAAKNLKIPIFLHESDSIPGKTNLYFAEFAKKIFLTFPQSKEYFGENKNKTINVGMPLCSEIFFGNKKEGYRIFGLEYGRPTILFWGGSQGAKKINEALLQILPKLLKKYQIIHLTGEKNIDEVKQKIIKYAISEKEKYYYHFFSKLEGRLLVEAILVADLVISRAGATSLFELAVNAKPVIIVPYLFAAQNHQYENAKIFEKREAAKIIIENENFSENLLKEINKIMKNQKEREKLSSNIFKLYRNFSIKAEEKIAKEILNESVRNY